MLVFLLILQVGGGSSDSRAEHEWMRKTPSEWPQITMVNEIEYTDTHHPIAGCSFLLDAGADTVVATAKHILTFFKSDSMNSVSFGGTLREWSAYPKNNPEDRVIVDRLINEDAGESIERVFSPQDWLLFTVAEKSPNMQPLRFRPDSLTKGEPVYVIGWRYSDKDCPQVVYKGAVVEYDNATVLISTERLADNKMPGLSGSPVIDSNGDLIGLMSQKAGKLERVSSIEYPKRILAGE